MPAQLHDTAAGIGHTRTRAFTRWLVHVAFIAAWIVIAMMAALTWAPQFTRFRTDVIVGQSMEPTIPLWSVIVVEPVSPDAIRAGDVITYNRPDEPATKVTHRVEQVTHRDGRPVFITRGDNNPVRDQYSVQYADEGWRVRWHVPHVGWAIVHAQSRIARVALVVVPTLVLLAQFLAWLWREPRAADDTGALPADDTTRDVAA